MHRCMCIVNILEPARGAVSLPFSLFFSVSIVSLFKNKSRREAAGCAPGGGLLSQHLRRKTPAGVFLCLANHSTCVCPEPVLAKRSLFSHNVKTARFQTSRFVPHLCELGRQRLKVAIAPPHAVL